MITDIERRILARATDSLDRWHKAITELRNDSSSYSDWEQELWDNSNEVDTEFAVLEKQIQNEQLTAVKNFKGWK